jgi:hypothetical protein
MARREFDRSRMEVESRHPIVRADARRESAGAAAGVQDVWSRTVSPHEPAQLALGQGVEAAVPEVALLGREDAVVFLVFHGCVLLARSGFATRWITISTRTLAARGFCR